MHRHEFGKDVSSSDGQGKSFKRKKNKHRRRGKSGNKSFMNSTSIESDYEKPNENFFKKDFLYDSHRNISSHSSIDFAEHSLTVDPNSYRKNNRKRSKSHNFVGSVSNSSFMNHEEDLPNRKRSSNESNKFYMNKKPKNNDSIETLLQSDAYLSSSEAEQLNINDDKLDSELFFFDISGNSYSSYGQAFAASFDQSLIDRENSNKFQSSNRNNIVSKLNDSVKVPKKFEKNDDVENSSHMNSHKPKKEITSSITDSFQVQEKLKMKKIKSAEEMKNKRVGSATNSMDENFANESDEFILDKLRQIQKTITEETSDKTKNRKMSNSYAEFEKVSLEDKDMVGNFKKPKISKKNNDSETMVDIRDSDCEMSVNDFQFSKKKKKKKRKDVPIPLEDILNKEGITSNKDDRTVINNTFNESKKRRDIESLVDIRDNDSEMSINASLNCEKKKKKKILKGDEQIEESIRQEKNEDCSINDRHDNVKGPNDQATCFKMPKKLNEKNNSLVVRESDSELSFGNDIYHEEKKKRKRHRKHTDIDIELNIDKKIMELIDDVTSTLVSKKKIKNTESLAGIKDSKCELSINDDSNRKKKKKNKIFIEEVPQVEESRIKKSNKLKERSITSTDPDCEMSFNNALCFKKKKKKRQETTNDNIIHDSNEKNTKELNNVMSSGLTSLKKFKKPKDIESFVNGSTHQNKIIAHFNSSVEHCDVREANKEASSLGTPKTMKKNNTLVDLRDSDCEMSFTDVSYHKKKKKKHKKNNNHESDKNVNEEPDNDVTTTLSSKESRKHEKIETMVDIRDSDCEMSVRNISNRKKKKRKDRENTDKGIQHNSDEEISKKQKKNKHRHTANDLIVGDVESISNEKCSNSSNASCNMNNQISLKEDDAPRKTGESDTSRIAETKTELDDNSKKSKKVKGDFINNSSKKIHSSSQNRFPENSLGNHNEDKELINSSAQNVTYTDYKALTSVRNSDPLLGTRYRAIYTSSSEGYQSDSSEIINPIKNHRRSTTKDRKQPNHVDEGTIEEGRGSRPGLREEVFDVPYKMNSTTGDVESAEENTQDEDVPPKSSKKRSKFTREYFDYLDEKSTNDEALLEIAYVDKEVTENDKEDVCELHVNCSFPVPELHSILRRLTTPTKDQWETIRELNLDVKTGPFSKEEDTMIVNNWNSFCKEHNLAVNPSLFINFPRRTRSEYKLNFLRWLARGLDNRLLHRVHARFKSLLENPRLKSGRFTAEEDEIIVNYRNSGESQQPFSKLAKLLNRTKTSIVKRYFLLTRVKNHTVVQWTPEMVDKFVSCIKEVTKCNKVKQLKDRKFTDTEWKKLSKKMDNIPVKKLQRGWNVTIYPRLFAKDVDAKRLMKIREEIIHTLHARMETDWKLVNWKEIAQDYNGFTPEKIYMMFKHIVNYHVPESLRKNLKDCVDFLENNVLKYGTLSAAHKFEKLVYKGGHIVKYGNE